MSVLAFRSFQWEGLQAELAHLRDNWGWFMAEGVLLTVFGLFATSVAVFTTIASMILFGWLLLLGGIALFVHSFFTGSWSGFFLEMLGGFLYGVAGLLLIGNPAISAVSLTLLLAPLLMVAGLFRAFGAIAYQFPHWGWACASGVISFALGVMIWKQLPGSALWVIGTVIGLELFFRGVLLMAFSLRLRTVPSVSEMRQAA